MRSFDFYEFTGVIAPGTIVLLCFALLYPEIRLLFDKDLTVGGLGIFLIVAYVAGHLTQAIGNSIEALWWKAWSGMPTDWARSGKGNLISDQQIEAMQEQLASKLKLQTVTAIPELSQQAWFAVTRQMHAAVAAESRAGRIDIFNGNYGLNRGIASALLIASLFTITRGAVHWSAALAALVGAGVALYRMHRFAKHYARELFVQFLQLPEVKT
jgi:hypothetical protein